ncbi:MAG: hypothetical protein KGL39_35745 [Patescibacteria group bacterium]|nr:hypothetical protein [Patescibacteria group bacterium]
MDTIIVDKVELHSHDHEAGAHVQGVHIKGRYQHPDGKVGEFTVHLEHTGSHGTSHPAGTDATGIRDAAVATARQHLGAQSALVDHIHHGQPHHNPRLHVMSQGQRILDKHVMAIEEERRNPKKPDPAAFSTPAVADEKE